MCHWSYPPEAILFTQAWLDVEAVRAVGKRIPLVFMIHIPADGSIKNSARSENKSLVQPPLVKLRVQM